MLLLLAVLAAPVPVAETDFAARSLDAYVGCWFNLGQVTEGYGPKYSGGLGTYTAHHRPMAVYSAEARKTFITYGSNDPATGDLTICVGGWDHAAGRALPPRQVMRWVEWTDPHNNAAIQLAPDGHLWLFVSGRARARAGYRFRSRQPHSTDDFELQATEELTYPQPWYVAGRGFLHLFTKYTAGRELYFETSDASGRAWADDVKLAGFGGHYQCSEERDGTIVTAFNWHPGGNVDQRTNVYVVQTRDFGQTWTTLDGRPLTLPLATVDNPALVAEHRGRGELAYLQDIVLDEQARPWILYVVSRDWRAGPSGDPREHRCLRWTGTTWQNTVIAPTDHNYDSGSLYLEGDRARALLPSEPGPQPWHTGGEIIAYSSGDGGATWTRDRAVTTNSPRNHGYVRRPYRYHPELAAMWADGDPRPGQTRESKLWISRADGSNVRGL